MLGQEPDSAYLRVVWVCDMLDSGIGSLQEVDRRGPADLRGRHRGGDRAVVCTHTR